MTVISRISSLALLVTLVAACSSSPKQGDEAQAQASQEATPVTAELASNNEASVETAGFSSSEAQSETPADATSAVTTAKFTKKKEKKKSSFSAERKKKKKKNRPKA